MKSSRRLALLALLALLAAAPLTGCRSPTDADPTPPEEAEEEQPSPTVGPTLL